MIPPIQQLSGTALRLLRALGNAWENLPVIMTSGRAETVSAFRATTKGVVDFLQKPFSEADLLQAVERALARGAATPA
jgi:two-component system response regulator FixJ